MNQDVTKYAMEVFWQLGCLLDEGTLFVAIVPFSRGAVCPR